MVEMFFKLQGQNLEYQDNRPRKKVYIKDIRTIDNTKKGLLGVNHCLTLINNNQEKYLCDVLVNCGHDAKKLYLFVTNILKKEVN